MSKKPTITRAPSVARYEYRVWGEHPRARKLLEQLASTVSEERVKDCYLLAGDGSWNAKVRNNRLKVKQLIAEDRGFERWSADRPRSAGDAPQPFDVLFEQLRLDRPQRGKSYDLYDAVDRLEADPDTKVVFVVKQRKRYTVGRLRAEATDIEIVETSEVMHTLAIEGEDLDDLVALRKKLGLSDQPNLAVHTAIALTGD
ncbi:MAG: hypothetical protein ABJH68_04870 [Ilumatobacter sp.]|uniref:hypothetical protein n=1 Tax=Ilumatobacter sp. TaxID=1967498 RepID=UPI00329A2474